MKEDIEFVRGSGNVFADLGFDDPDGELKRANERMERRHQQDRSIAAQKKILLTLDLKNER